MKELSQEESYRLFLNEIDIRGYSRRDLPILYRHLAKEQAKSGILMSKNVRHISKCIDEKRIFLIRTSDLSKIRSDSEFYESAKNGVRNFFYAGYKAETN